MHTAVLKEINNTCECFYKEVILKEFEAYSVQLVKLGLGSVQAGLSALKA